MDLINIFTEIGMTLSPLLAVLLIYMFNRINNNDKRISRLESQSDKTTDILNDLKENVAFIRAKIESLEK